MSAAGCGTQQRRAGRLPRGAGFQRVLKQGRRAASAHLRLLALPNGGTAARLGVIAGRKVEPLAVRRNYFKRVVREEFRLDQSALQGMDIIVQLKRSLGAAGGARLRAELAGLLAEVRKWRG